MILFVLILVTASVFVSDLSLDMESQFTAALGLSAMVVFGALIAIFIGVGLVYKEIDKRTIYSLLSKPVHRHEFIIGKYAGLCLTLLVNTAVMVLATELALLYVNGKFVPLQTAVLAASALVYLELALLVAVALMFSSFSTPMLAALFSFAIYVIGHFSKDLLVMAVVIQFNNDARHPCYFVLSASESLKLRVHNRSVAWANRALHDGGLCYRLRDCVHWHSAVRRLC